MTLEGVMGALPINWRLISNPVNWIIVFLMVAVAGAAIAVVFTATGAHEEQNG